MINTTDVTLDCHTCLAANTTACSECVVSHLLANDDGPIEFVPTPVRVQSQAERAVEMFANAGLLDAEPVFVAQQDFDAARIPEFVG